MTTPTRAAGSRSRGFTLIELLIALAVVAILVRIAFPSYQAYIVRSSRQAAQSELVALANAQERIFLNSNSYTGKVTSPYNGQSTGGLGVPDLNDVVDAASVDPGKSKDSRYTFSVAGTATTFTLTATPTGAQYAGDPLPLTISETGQRKWGTSGKTW